MLQAIWEILGNYGVDLNQVAQALSSVISPNYDEDGNIIGYSGYLAAFVDLPYVGDVIKQLADIIASNLPNLD